MEGKCLSVIIPTYKRSVFLSRAIDSVINSFEGCEIIVVDDNGIGTEVQIENEKILKKYLENKNIKYIKHKTNLNGAAARNTGVLNSSSKYITFLDDDDEFCQERVSEIFKKIEECDYDLIFSNTIVKRRNNHTDIYKPRVNYKDINALIFETLCQNSFIRTGSNMVCKKSIFDSIDGFDVSFRRNQDMEFLVRYLSKCESVGYIDKDLIIKNEIDYMNVPKLDNYLCIKDKFLKKYDSLINNFDRKHKIKIYQSNYFELLKLACIDNDRISKKKIIKKLNEHDAFSIFLYLKYTIKYSIVHLRNSLRKMVKKYE